MQGIQWTKMLIEQRKDVLLQQLDLSCLEGWWEANQVNVQNLLGEYHDIFLLEPRELCCTNLEKHEIRVVDNKPFKEQFQRIPPPMTDEVWTHMKEMLEVGAIHPSQSPWCKTVVLVCKKDKLNARTKKDSYLIPQIQEAIGSLVGAAYFSCLEVKVGFWHVVMDKELKQYTALTVGNLGFFWMQTYVLQAVQCPCHILEINAEIPRRIELNILLTLLGWHDSLLKDGGGALAALACHVWLLLGTQFEFKTHKVWILPEWD